MNPIKFFFIVVLLLVSAGLCEAAASGSTRPEPITRNYCTNVGPIALTFEGEKVVGRYRISVKNPADEGTIQGTFKDGLLDAIWAEERSTGRILIGFSSDFSRLYAIYNSNANPSHWWGQWHGMTRDAAEKLTGAQRAELRCD
jgi:hypothetical protein